SPGDYEGSIAYGYKGERANLLLSGGYRHRSEMSVKERDWALRTGPQGYLENPLGGWAGTGNPGQYQTATTAPVGSPNTGYTAGSFAGSLPDIGCGANGGAPYILTTTIVSPTSCNFQYTSFDNLVEDEDHYQLYGKLNVDITDNIQGNVEVLWASHNTPLQSWAITGPNQYPAPILASGASPGGGVSPIPASGTGEQSRFYIPNTNPGLIALLGQIATANCSGAVLPYGVDATTCAQGLATAQSQAANAALHGVASSQTAWRPLGFAGNPYTSDRHSHYSYKIDTLRIAGGFKGKFENGIGWELGLTYQEQDFNYNLQDTSVNRLQLGLRGYGSRAGNADQCTAAETANFTTNAGNAALGCFYFNPFTNAIQQSLSNVPANPYYVGSSSTIAGLNDAVANRGAVFDWMDEEQRNEITDKLFVADLIFNGESSFKLWGSDNISWAAGAQFRYDRRVQDPDALYDANATPCVDSPPFGDGTPYCPTTANGPFLFNANLRPYDVERKIGSGFFEVRLPITDSLEGSLAGRYEYYQGQGETFNPKAALRWQALDWLALRGSVSTTYRAPAATITTTNFSRGLTNASGTYRANDLFGNPNLDPETALTYSVGAMVKIGGFNATVDYWNFDFKDQLTSEATLDLLNLMFPTGGPNKCGNAALAARFTFDSAGCAGGRPSVLSYRTQYINGGQVKTDGVDFQANLQVGELFGGDLSTGFDGTYLLNYDDTGYAIEGLPTSAAGVIKRAGTYRASLFTGYNRLRANAYVNWAAGGQNLRWQVRHVSSTTQIEPNSINIAAAVKSTTKVAEYWQHDLTYRAELPWDTALTLSVMNVLDQEPPFAIGTQYNYDPGSGNPLGRVYTIGVKKRF
ncbi:TonB-dependent receptor domain-containing protein, partial [Phenylobacterium sp.]|uniref:TonB-dependent receptor domain-containing protein n=1 Tax=Phenylobacterium sp. TaxID=1871053 RepID=UPI00273512CF